MARDKTKANKPKKARITDEIKMKIAVMVKERPCLWQLSNPKHRKHDQITNAWVEISTELGVEESQCRDAWKSLKDAMRYYQRRSNKCQGKSGAAAEDCSMDEDSENEDNTSVDDSWKFYDVMRFMMEKPKRKTISSSVFHESEPVEPAITLTPPANECLSGIITLNIDEIDKSQQCDKASSSMTEKANISVVENEGKLGVEKKPDLEAAGTRSASTFKRAATSNYDFVSKKKRLSSDKSADDRIAESIQSLVDWRKTTAEPSMESNPKDQDKLKYFSMFLNMDRMLQKLPEESVEELNFQFITLIRDEMKKTAQTL